MIKVIVLITTCLITLNVAGQSQQYSDKVQKMLALTGAQETFSTTIDQMLEQMKGLRTDVSDELWNELGTELKRASINDLVGMLTPIYFKYLTESDIDGIIAFYETPIGRKYAKNTPAITRESMQAGQQWGMKIGQSIAERLQKEGY